MLTLKIKVIQKSLIFRHFPEKWQEISFYKITLFATKVNLHFSNLRKKVYFVDTLHAPF
jgi:hypothetical protein